MKKLISIIVAIAVCLSLATPVLANPRQGQQHNNHKPKHQTVIVNHHYPPVITHDRHHPHQRSYFDHHGYKERWHHQDSEEFLLWIGAAVVLHEILDND